MPWLIEEAPIIIIIVAKGQKNGQTMFQKSGLYMWLVLTMGIFYGIPAIQLVR